MSGRPFRFLHTADWQIGMQATGRGTAAERVREARLAAAFRTVRLAGELGAECLVIAGDLFEDNAVDPLLVQRVVDLLDRAPCPVFILPGNHDPLVAGSVYDRQVWQRAANVVIWRTAAPYPFRPGVVFFPCPTVRRAGGDDPTAWIPRRKAEEDVVRVGVAHGSLRGLTAEEDESADPIDPAAAGAHDLDYLALGHWHSTFFYPPGPVVRTAYSGTQETTRFGERDSGNALLVEIAEPGAVPRLQKLATGELRWRQESRDLHSDGDLEALLRAWDRADPEEAARTLLELTVRGVVPAAVAERLEADLRPLLAARFLFVRLRLEELLLEPTERELLDIAPGGPVRAVAGRLLALSSGGGGERERAVARRALADLFALSREVDR